MLVSFNWLKQHVDLSDTVTAKELGDKLTMGVVEVEGVEQQGSELVNIVVGKIKQIDKHPNADKLQVCLVDNGKKTVQVVCGGSNIKEGQLIALAPPGAKVRWHGQGDLIELEKTKIRGTESFGMICASTEIGLGEMFPLSDEAEILDLSEFGFKAGQPLAEALGLNDTVFDIDNKSMTHRPDLWGHYGMAREVSALYGKELSKYDPPAIKEEKDIKLTVKVEDNKLCPRYMAVTVNGVKIEPSPKWLQEKLLAVGLRPINNIVDITNYILFDLGQPMHAFDAKNLAGKDNNKKIIVRKAKDKEMFKTLDGISHRLDSRDLVIADSDKAVALAGVMGGENSEISENTTTIIFESANFDATTIRRTATRLGLRTDSSARFEKSLDPVNAELALRRAVQLTLELCPSARVVSNLADQSSFKPDQGPIELAWDFLWKKLGKKLEEKKVIKILTDLGFVVKERKGGIIVTVPTWRATKDISIAEDLVEEVARIYGYDNIEPVLPLFPITPPAINQLRQTERGILQVLSKDLGYSEVSNYSFVSERQIKNLQDKIENYIELDNPISKEKPYLRRNLLLNMLENVDKNIEYFELLKIMEVGKIFLGDKKGEVVSANSKARLPKQDVYLTTVFASKKDKNPFLQARLVVETICGYYNLELNLNSEVEVASWQHPARNGGVVVDGVELGNIFEVHPLVLQDFGLEVKVGVVEINLNKLTDIINEGAQKVKTLPEFPQVVRDLAIVVKQEVSFEEINKAIKSIDKLLQSVEMFDLYEGKNIGEGYKSMAWHLTYGSNDRTLTAEEVDVVQVKLIKELEDKFDAQVRK